MEPAALKRRVADNLARVRQSIADAAHGRSITLVCVTKYAQDAWVVALLDAGATDLAENLLPRASERFADLFAQGYRFTRHLIGAQQSRKLKYIPGNFDWLQALDRVDSAQTLERELEQTDCTLDVLIQVNVASEEQKHGVLLEETETACAYVVENCRRLRLRGLMAIPPWPDAYGSTGEFERGTRLYFRQMYELFARIRNNYPGVPLLDTLSLGMSQDYSWAIAEGATMVRVGSALFEGLEG